MIRSFGKLCLAHALTRAGADVDKLPDIVLEEVGVIEEIKQSYFNASLVNTDITVHIQCLASYEHGALSTAVLLVLCTSDGKFQYAESMMAGTSNYDGSGLDTLDALSLYVAHHAIALGTRQYPVGDYAEMLRDISIRAVDLPVVTEEK